MATTNHCSSCGLRNNGSLSYCGLCGGKLSAQVRNNPINSESFRAEKMVIFDIDNTLLSSDQRYKDAVRAGLINKEGTPKRSGFQTPGNALKKSQDFLFSREALQKDTLISGATAVIDHFVSKGYTVAYLTARSYKHYEATKSQLQHKKIPIFQDPSGRDLLFLNNKPGKDKAKFKREVFIALQAQYDISAVFDDTVEVLNEAASLGIPGVYESVKDYGKYITRSNPNWHSSLIDDKGYPREDPDAEPYDSADCHSDPEGMGRVPYSAKSNPANPSKVQIELKNKTQADKVNKARRELKSKGITFDSDITGGKYPRVRTWYLDFSLKGGTSKQVIAHLKKAKIPHKLVNVKPNPANPSKIEKAQKQAQAAYAGGYRGNPSHSEDYMVPRDIHKLGKAADSLEGTYADGMEVPEWWKSKLSVTAKDADTIADSLDYVANNPNYDLLPIYSGKPSGRSKNLGAVFAEVYIGRNIFKDVGEVVQTIYRGLIGGRTSMAEARMTMAIAAMEKELSDRATELGGNAVANLKLDYEIVQQTASTTIIATADALKVTPAPKKTKIKTNPANPSKVSKGKKLYKQFNGEECKKVETIGVDIGDTWYSLGSCWSLGYLSNKEGAGKSQKYIHHTNEESKDGNYPTMYATMPDKGEPMIVIKGGTMKIGIRDGVAWLID